MKNLKLLQILLCCLLFAISPRLMGKGVLKTNPGYLAHDGKNVVVICDVSPSIDGGASTSKNAQTRFDIMIRQCQNVLTAYPPHTTFSFFYVSRNANSAPFARITSDEVNKMNGAAIAQKFTQCKKWLKKSITQEAEHPESQSCIMTSIESAYIMLKGIASERRKNSPSDIIVISDMVEVCWASPLDTLVMNVAKGKDILSAKKIKKIKAYNSGVDFDALGINIKILFNASKMDIGKEKQLESIWRLIFEKYNYKAASNPEYQLFQTNYIFKKDAYYTDNGYSF